MVTAQSENEIIYTNFGYLKQIIQHDNFTTQNLFCNLKEVYIVYTDKNVFEDSS